MREIIRKHHISFKNAFSGLIWSFSTQPNFIIHLFLALTSVLLGWFLKLNSFEWALLVFTIFWGLAAEMINTAIESVCDLVTSEWKKEIKIAKDVSAGMMLLVSLGTVIVALFLFLPKLIMKIF
jgi:diacylglycerol kinase (ATP)